MVDKCSERQHPTIKGNGEAGGFTSVGACERDAAPETGTLDSFKLSMPLPGDRCGSMEREMLGW
jgi:hypothetical protein